MWIWSVAEGSVEEDDKERRFAECERTAEADST